jgi:hypothetical protein
MYKIYSLTLGKNGGNMKFKLITLSLVVLLLLNVADYSSAQTSNTTIKPEEVKILVHYKHGRVTSARSLLDTADKDTVWKAISLSRRCRFPEGKGGSSIGTIPVSSVTNSNNICDFFTSTKSQNANIKTRDEAIDQLHVVNLRVIYDVNGKVTSVSLIDKVCTRIAQTALSIARRRRFKPGQAGTTVIKVPVEGRC